MPLDGANYQLIPAIPLGCSFLHPSHPLRMPLAKAYHFFISVILLGCHCRSLSFVHPGHPLRMPLAETNYQSQPGHRSRMPLVVANHKTQLGHLSRMPLTKANY